MTNKYCPITGKRSYYTIAAAELVLRILKSRNVKRRHDRAARLYICQFCNSFHLTSQPYQAERRK